VGRQLTCPCQSGREGGSDVEMDRAACLVCARLHSHHGGGQCLDILEHRAGAPFIGFPPGFSSNPANQSGDSEPAITFGGPDNTMAGMGSLAPLPVNL